jgi:hypothetical protein
MDLFVVFFTTMELIPKGLVSLFLYPFLKQDNPTQMQTHLADFYGNYAKALETIPFYDHDYADLRADLAQKYQACTDRTWVDWFSWSCLSMELLAKRVLAVPLRYLLHQDADTAVVTTDILVKCNDTDSDTENRLSPEHAKARFNSKLAELRQNHQVTLVGEVHVKDRKEGKDHLSTYARLRVPRYMAFQPLVHAMADRNMHVRKIAGQDLVQVKCEIKGLDAEAEIVMEAREQELNQKQNVTPLYTYSDRIHSNYKVCLFEVPVKNLHQTLQAMKYEDGQAKVDVSFIHNF